MSKINVGLVFGGRSEEHEISIISAKSIFDALDKKKYNVFCFYIKKNGDWERVKSPDKIKKDDLKCKKNKLNKIPYDDFRNIDLFFPVLHGPFGEDGTIQGFFETIGKPYAGCGVLGSAVGMDKITTKKILRADGINIVDFVEVEKTDFKKHKTNILKTISDTLKFPVFVKPSSLGSSVGVMKSDSEYKLEDAIENALNFSNKILVEKAINGKEIECSVLGRTEDPKASLPGRVIPYNEFYDYEDKYILGKTKFEIPAKLKDEKIYEIQETAKKVFSSLSLYGMARVDFFLENETEKLYVNEVNTIPGFTKISMYPKLWEVSGIPFKELLNMIIELALEKEI